MGALTIRDLKVVAGEPRVRDIDLGERLGFDRPINVRKLIRRHRGRLEKHGIISTVEIIHGRAGRPGAEYWLNRRQPLTVCILADTEKAVDVQEQVLDVFVAYQDGALVFAQQGEDLRHGGANPLPPMAAALEALVAQTQRLVAYLDNHERLNAPGAVEAMQHAAIVTRPGKKRLSDIERDPAVAKLAAAYHRRMTIQEAAARIALEVGEERAPSWSALQRHWAKLDQQLSGRTRH